MAFFDGIRSAWSAFTCADRDPQVVAGLTSRLFSTTSVGRLPPVLCMSMLSIMDYERTGITLPALVLLLHFWGRYAISDLCKRYYASPISAKDAIRWAWRLTAMSAITGASWGLAAVVWFNPENYAQSLLLGVLLVGVCTGSLLARVSFAPCAAAHILSASVPYLAVVMLSGIENSTVLGIAGAFYLFWLLSAGRHVHHDNVVTMELGVENARLIANLTDTKYAEETARAQAEASRDEAETANKAKSEFLAIVSHELRTPLNGILGMASVLADTELTEPQRKAISTIKGAGEALSLIVDDLLDLTRMEAGHTKLEPQETNLRRLIESVVQILRIRAWEKRIALNVEIAADVPEDILGDPGRLRQILINLAGNAVKFTERGAITIRAKISEKSKDQLRIEVEDTGIGIPEYALDRLFKPFSQVDQSYTRAYGGTGLGLAIVKRLACLMHGDVGVESQIGIGSRFWIEIPLLQVERTLSSSEPILPQVANSIVPASAQDVPRELGSLRILVVDDSLHMRLMLRAVLTVGGHQIEEAESGEVAIERLKADGIDAVILDLEMPGLNGAATAHLIRAMPQYATLPIIGLSGHDLAHVSASGLASAADLVLSKPLMPDVLLSAIQRVHNGRPVAGRRQGHQVLQAALG